MPGKLTARDVAITVTPVVENNGVFTPVTPFTVTGRAGTLTITKRRENERVEADDASGADRAPTKDDFTVSVEALKFSTATGDLSDKFDAYAHFAIAVRMKRGGGFKTETYTGLATELNWNKQIGRNVDNMTIERVETGSPNPAIS